MIEVEYSPSSRSYWIVFQYRSRSRQDPNYTGVFGCYRRSFSGVLDPTLAMQQRYASAAFTRARNRPPLTSIYLLLRPYIQQTMLIKLNSLATSSTSPFGLWGSRLLLSRHLARYSGSDLDVAPRLEDDTGSWVAAHSSLKICDLEKREI